MKLFAGHLHAAGPVLRNSHPGRTLLFGLQYSPISRTGSSGTGPLGGEILDHLRACKIDGGPTFYDAAVQTRERFRLRGRPLPRRAVGSTLLLKGLEADEAVILSADNLDAKNLYVVLIRASKGLTICSRGPVLTPEATPQPCPSRRAP